MLALGCDVGTMFTKTVVMDNGHVMGHNITRNTGALREIVDASIHHAAEMEGGTLDDIHVRGGTGMGDKYIGIDHVNEGVIKCIARGACWALKEVRTVVDLGGLSTTIISLGETGRVIEYRTSDKCASGSGFFLELAAQALERGEQVKLSGFGVFQVRAKRARMGRNPKTGEPAAIEPRRVIGFRASQVMKARVDRALGK